MKLKTRGGAVNEIYNKGSGIAALFKKSPYATTFLNFNDLTYTLFENGTTQTLGNIVLEPSGPLPYANSYATLQDGNIVVQGYSNSTSASASFANNNTNLSSNNLGIYDTINFKISTNIDSFVRVTAKIDAFGDNLFTPKSSGDQKLNNYVVSKTLQTGQFGNNFNINVFTSQASLSSVYGAKIVVNKIWLSIS